MGFWGASVLRLAQQHVGMQPWTADPTCRFERFTEKAIKVVMLAQEEARRLGHNFVGTEQLLLGLIGESTGIAAKVLKSMGVNLKGEQGWLQQGSLARVCCLHAPPAPGLSGNRF